MVFGPQLSGLTYGSPWRINITFLESLVPLVDQENNLCMSKWYNTKDGSNMQVPIGADVKRNIFKN